MATPTKSVKGNDYNELKSVDITTDQDVLSTKTASEVLSDKKKKADSISKKSAQDEKENENKDYIVQDMSSEKITAEDLPEKRKHNVGELLRSQLRPRKFDQEYLS